MAKRPEPMSMTESHVRDLIPLLKEYTGKVREMVGTDVESQPRHRKMQDFEIHEFMRRMYPAIEELSGLASQLVEYGGINDVIRIELRLRLAELESAMHIAKQRY